MSINKNSIYKPSFDAEKQKLAKTYVDLLQKQFIFDEVLKIIEEEGIDIEGLFLAAFERLGEAAAKEEEENEEEQEEGKEMPAELTESRKESDHSNYSDQFLVELHSSKKGEGEVAGGEKMKLNFKNIKEGQEGGGFHEEFMKNIDSFSLSWRMQALKEMERGKRKDNDEPKAPN